MKLGYIILYVPDVAASVDFWERAFGLTRRFVHESGSYAEMDTGATALAFVAETMAAVHGIAVRHAYPHEQPAAFEIALVTGDPAAALERAVAAGAAKVKEAEAMPWGQTVAYARDLNGVLVELCTPVA